MTELKCKNCGAPIRRDGVCEYCGSVYQVDYAYHFPVMEYEPLSKFVMASSACVYRDEKGRLCRG